MGVAIRVGVCIAVGGAIAVSLFAASSPASAQRALVDAVSKRVTVAHAGGITGEIVGEQIIRSGDTVATDETGRAVVTYPDGSTALLEEKSALTIEFVQISAGDYAVRMQQTLGRVWYAVTKTVTLGGRYEVRSAGMASVIRAGSDSYITVSPSGETTVVTISGTVDTTGGGVALSVPTGSSTTVAAPGATPVPIRPAPVAAQPTASTPKPVIPATTPTPIRAAPPSPSGALVPPVAVLPSLPVKSATSTPGPRPPTVSFRLTTPKLNSELSPIATRVDEPGEHEDAPALAPKAKK